MADRELLRAIGEVVKELHEINRHLRKIADGGNKPAPMPNPYGEANPPLPLPDVASQHPYFQRSPQEAIGTVTVQEDENGTSGTIDRD